MSLAGGGLSQLLSPAVSGLQLADVGVRLAVAAAHRLALLALAHALREPSPGGVLAFQPVSARQVVLKAAGRPLALGAHQAAVAAVGHVTAGADRARTQAHIAASLALGPGLRTDQPMEVKHNRDKQKRMHGPRRTGMQSALSATGFKESLLIPSVG